MCVRVCIVYCAPVFAAVPCIYSHLIIIAIEKSFIVTNSLCTVYCQCRVREHSLLNMRRAVLRVFTVFNVSRAFFVCAFAYIQKYVQSTHKIDSYVLRSQIVWSKLYIFCCFCCYLLSLLGFCSSAAASSSFSVTSIRFIFIVAGCMSLI